MHSRGRDRGISECRSAWPLYRVPGYLERSCVTKKTRPSFVPMLIIPPFGIDKQEGWKEYTITYQFGYIGHCL